MCYNTTVPFRKDEFIFGSEPETKARTEIALVLDSDSAWILGELLNEEGVTIGMERYIDRELVPDDLITVVSLAGDVEGVNACIAKVTKFGDSDSDSVYGPFQAPHRWIEFQRNVPKLP